MTILNLTEIFTAYTDKKIDKDSAIDYLKSIIENKDDIESRRKAVEDLGKIDSNSEKFFKYFENLLISDTDGYVRANAAKIIIEKFSSKAYRPIKWVLERENNHSCLESIANGIIRSSNDNLKSLLKSIKHVIYDGKAYLCKNSGLDLSGLGIKNIKNVENLKNLKDLIWLNLSYNNINEIEGLSTLRNLKFLTLGNNLISEIKGIGNLKNLTGLHLFDNKISEIKGLEGLSNLRSINLNNNQISDIKNLETLTKLNLLSLNNNNISEIKALETLLNLVILQLNDNKILEIKGLDNLKRLTTLNLCNNKIKEIIAPQLPNLFYLSIDYNPIPQEQLTSFYKQRRKIIDFRYL